MALSDTYEWLDTWEWLRLINSSLKIIGSFSLGGPHRLMGWKTYKSVFYS